MHHDEITKTGETLPPTAPSTKQREQLYLNAYPSLRDAVFTAHPNLSFLEADAILVRLSQRLHRFICDSVPDFLRLASQYVRNWARHQWLYLLCVTDPKNVRSIQSAIRRTLHTDYEDRAVETEDLFGELCLYLYSHVNQFLPKATDTAALSTRLFALTKRHIFFDNAKRYRRFNIVAENLTTLGQGGAEFLSPLELASMRAEESESDEG